MSVPDFVFSLNKQNTRAGGKQDQKRKHRYLQSIDRLCYANVQMGAKLTQDQRGRVGEKIMEWGNLLFAGLVIGQLVSSAKIKPLLAGLGIAGIAGAYFVAYRIMTGGDNS